MSDNVYKVIEIVGSSPNSIEEAIEKAVSRASTSLKEIRWFEVKETRGHIEDGRVAHFQVTLKIGFRIDEPGKSGTGNTGAPEPGTDPLHEGP